MGTPWEQLDSRRSLDGDNVLPRAGAACAYIARAMTQWLEVTSRSGAAEAVISAMANKLDLPSWGSKGNVNRAGDAIRAATISDNQALILESWRLAHRQVIHTFEAFLRARAKTKMAAGAKKIEVAQRLKRRHTIVDKLHRYPWMQLARMDDVAGCRLIFSDIEKLYEFRDQLHRGRFKHVLRNEKDKYDYIKHPTDRGYRGIHDIYEYRARKGRSTACNGLLIEIQFRTQLQHSWGTAVEVITQMTEHEPKFNRGDPRYVRIFCVASEMLARTQENMKACLPNASDRELVEEFDSLDDEIGIISSLLDLSINKWIGDRAESEHVILQVTKDGAFRLHQYDLELEASRALLELEKANPEDNIVLVGAASVAEVMSAFRNYFNDVEEFIRMINVAREELKP